MLVLARRPKGRLWLKVAAAGNCFGIADLYDLLDHPKEETYAVQWLGSPRDRREDVNLYE